MVVPLLRVSRDNKLFWITTSGRVRHDSMSKETGGDETRKKSYNC